MCFLLLGLWAVFAAGTRNQSGAFDLPSPVSPVTWSDNKNSSESISQTEYRIQNLNLHFKVSCICFVSKLRLDMRFSLELPSLCGN